MKKYLALIFGFLPLALFAADPSPQFPVYANGRLLVDVGTNITFSGTVTTETNVSLANITTTNPLPVSVVGGTNTLEVAGPIPVYTPTNLNVGGFTFVGGAAVNVDTTATGVAANDVLAPGIEIANAVRSSGGSGLIQSLTWIHGGTLADPAVIPSISILVCSGQITWPATNAAANLVQTQIATNLLGIVQFKTGDFVQAGTNWIASKTSLGIGVKPIATTLYLYPINGAAITNSNPSRIGWTILQD